METSLRRKALDFGAVHHSYESISKHNQVRGSDPDTLMHTPHVGTRLAPGWSAAPVPERGERCWGGEEGPG